MPERWVEEGAVFVVRFLAFIPRGDGVLCVKVGCGDLGGLGVVIYLQRVLLKITAKDLSW